MNTPIPSLAGFRRPDIKPFVNVGAEAFMREHLGKDFDAFRSQTQRWEELCAEWEKRAARESFQKNVQDNPARIAGHMLDSFLIFANTKEGHIFWQRKCNELWEGRSLAS